MKNILLTGFLLMLFCTEVLAQDMYYTREGRVSFFSEAPLENIEAHNNRASTVLDAETGAIEFSVLIRGFMFEKSLMQEHFNENFMESHKYPRAEFKGKIANIEKVNLNEDGIYPVQITGEMKIRDIVKEITAEGELRVVEGRITGNSLFELTVADFDITIPAVVRDNIARVVEVKVEADFKPLER